LPDGTGSGYVWRLHSIARYEQREGGVDLELEAIALTRDIPASVSMVRKPDRQSPLDELAHYNSAADARCREFHTGIRCN